MRRGSLFDELPLGLNLPVEASKRLKYALITANFPVCSGFTFPYSLLISLLG